MNSPVPHSARTYTELGGRCPTALANNNTRPLLHLQQQQSSESPPAPGPAEDSTDSPSLGQRSVSLITLQQPRMAQLETLEAKMASIEVSLSSTPRRKKNGSLGGISLGSSIRSIPRELIAAKELESLRNALRDKENIIQSLKGQLTVPESKMMMANHQKNGGHQNNNTTEQLLSPAEKKQTEERLNRLKIDIDSKRLAIKNLKMILDRLDITDNIDVRIQQAELEYQLGREELNLLTLLEETRTLQLCLEESNKNSSDSYSLYRCVSGNGYIILHGVEVDYNPKSPKFVASEKDSSPGLWIDWALDETGLCKGDRLVEVNGKIVLTKTRDDLARLLAAAPDPAQIVILRRLNENGNVITTSSRGGGSTNKEVSSLRTELEAVRERAEEAQKTKDGLISDNIRLTHRISYLEEQVSELLCRNKSINHQDVKHTPQKSVISTVKTNQNVTNINITTQPSLNTTQQHQKDVQLFQKGPQMTMVSSSTSSGQDSLPLRSKSSLSNVSNTHIVVPQQPISDSYHYHNKGHRHKHKSSRHSLQPDQHNVEENGKITYRKHNHNHHHHGTETSSIIPTNDISVSKYNKRNLDNIHRYSIDQKDTMTTTSSSDIMDQSYKKATKIVHELTRTNNKDLSLYEKHRQKCITASDKYINTDILKHYNSRRSASVLDFRQEINIGSKMYSDSKSAEELDTLMDNSNDIKKYMYKRLQDSRSIKSLDFDSDCNSVASTNYRTNGSARSVDYTSEPIESSNRKLSYYSGYYNGENGISNNKPRPMPPKKPLRLSLHKTQSLQSVETPPVTPGNSPNNKNESRKRNYKGEIPLIKGCENGYHESPRWASNGHLQK